MADAHLIGSIYEAVLDPSHLESMLAGVSEHADATIGHIDIEDCASGEVMLMAGHRLNDEIRAQYLDRYRALDPRRALLSGVAPGDWRLTQDHFDGAFLRKHPYYREFAIPSGGGYSAVTHLDFGYFRGFVGIGRSMKIGPFTDASRRRLASLSPHLRRASTMTALAARSLSLQFALRALLDHVADAVIVASSAGKVLYANAAGNAILDGGDGLQLTQRHLHASDPHTNELIARTLEAAAVVRPRSSPLGTREATIRVPRGSGLRPWLISILPVTPPTEMGSVAGIPCAAIWVLDPDRERRITPEWLRFALDVTPAEARVAHAIFRGASVLEAAKQLGIGEATVKTHLAHVFSKTGMPRQVDLVRFIAGLKPNFR